MQLYHEIAAVKTQIQIPRIDLATEGLDLKQVAKYFEVSPEQLAVSIDRGWFPDGETVDGRKVWHPHFMPVLTILDFAEKKRGDLPESWPLADGVGPFLQSGPSGIAQAWQNFPMDLRGTVSIAVFLEITKVYFTKSADPSECWEIQRVADHFNVTVGQLRRSIEHGVFPDARLIDGRMMWIPGFISILTDFTEYCKSTGRLSPSWPVTLGDWGDSPVREVVGEIKARSKVKRHLKKRRAA